MNKLITLDNFELNEDLSTEDGKLLRDYVQVRFGKSLQDYEVEDIMDATDVIIKKKLGIGSRLPYSPEKI